MFDISKVKTPCYVVDEAKLLKNLTILDNVMEKTGCKILLAQKAFSMYSTYPMISQHLKGTTASGLYEARLGYEEMKKENHVFAPAYKTEDMKELVTICDHIIFNSFAQFEKHKEFRYATISCLTHQNSGRNSRALLNKATERYPAE